MKLKIIFIYIFITLVPLLSYADNITAKSAIVVDAKDGTILYEKNIHERLLPASTAKLVTALVVIDHCRLDQKFKVSKNAFNVEPTKVYLSPGREYSVSHLLYSILMSSANDAAIVLAEGIAGTEEKFAEMMNEKCKQIGANESKFANASGLPSKTKQYTTVYDLAIIMSAIKNNPILLYIMKKKKRDIKGSDNKLIRLFNRNKLLYKNKDGVIVGKTGYTRKAGQCFAGYKDVRGSSNDIIFAMLGGNNLWIDISNLISAGKLNTLAE